MPEHKRPSAGQGDATKLLKSIDEWQLKLPPSQRHIPFWFGLALAGAGLVNYLRFQETHEHEVEGWTTLAVGFLQHHGVSLVMILLGIGLMIPPVGVRLVVGMRTVWRSTAGRFLKVPNSKG